MTTALLVLLVAYSVVYIATQAFYALGLLTTAYIFSLPVDWVDMNEKVSEPESEWPYIVLFYPVLRELETTMRTTMLSLTKLEYPADRYRVVAIPNSDDAETIASLRRLMAEFPFLKMLEVPPTSDSSWQIVWDAWDANPKAYWWHQGPPCRRSVSTPEEDASADLCALPHRRRAQAREESRDQLHRCRQLPAERSFQGGGNRL